MNNKDSDVNNAIQKQASVAASAYVADSAKISGRVTISSEACICDGVTIVADGGAIDIGKNTVIMENTVIRSSPYHHCTIGKNVIVGPHSHLSGCRVESEVFIATGVSIFNDAHIKSHTELRINAVVHVNTVVESESVLPIGWIAVGNPAQFFSPDQHAEIWAIQKTLNFPKTVFGLERDQQSSDSLIKQISDNYSKSIIKHRKGNKFD